MLTNYGLANKLAKRVGSKHKPKKSARAFQEHNLNLLDISDQPNFAQTQFINCKNVLMAEQPQHQQPLKKKKKTKRGSSALRSSRSSLSSRKQHFSGKKDNDLGDLIMSTAHHEHHHLVYQTPKRDEFDGMALIDTVVETSPQAAIEPSSNLECIPSENESSSVIAHPNENQGTRENFYHAQEQMIRVRQ